MKKLMVAAFAIAFAAVAQAATVTWNATGLAAYNGTTDGISGNNVYAFDTSVLTQQALLVAFGTAEWDATLATGYVAGIDNYDSGDATGEIDGYANNQVVDAYLAIVDGDKLFISAVDGNGGKIGSAGQGITIDFDLTDSIANIMAPGTDTFSGAGWYSAAESVPEPTSAMLLMLGLAGLALRRKQA